MTITIETRATTVAVTCPYHTSWTAEAKRAGGKWSAERRQWVFPIEQIGAVRRLLVGIFGDDGTGQVATVRLRVTDVGAVNEGGATDITIGGRQVARVFGRDSGAKIGDLVVIVAGAVRSGGSRANPRIVKSDDMVVDLLRLPEVMARKLIAEHPTACRVVADDGSDTPTAQPAGDNVVRLHTESAS